MQDLDASSDFACASDHALKRLRAWIESQASARLREMAMLAAEDLDPGDDRAYERAQTLLACLARQALAADVFDAVAARAA